MGQRMVIRKENGHVNRCLAMQFRKLTAKNQCIDWELTPGPLRGRQGFYH